MAQLFGSSYQEILKFLECPVCFETVYPPIFQCKNGHMLCSRCKDGIRNNRCPVCLVELGNTRSLVLERFLPLVKLPCTYHTTGCNEIVAYETRKEHEKGCKHRPYKCPYEDSSSSSSSSSSQCNTEGDITLLLSHLQISHNLSFNSGSEFQLPLCRIQKGYKCYNQHFFFHIDSSFVSDDVLMAYLTVMGDETLAMKYRYSLKIVNGDNELNWKGSPRSIRETKEDIWRNGDALLVHSQLRERSFSWILDLNHIIVKGKIWAVTESAIKTYPNPKKLISVAPIIENEK